MRSQRRIPSAICRYLSFKDPRSGKFFKLPLVHIRIKNGDISFKTDALIDSGATSTFMMAEFVDLLELQAKLAQASEEDIVGAGGHIKARRIPLDSMSILKSNDVFCNMKNVSVLVPPLGAIPFVVLGRDTVFREHDITFRENQRHLIFRCPQKSK